MLRTMKGTFSRFIAIAAIVALGVGLLSGLMAMPIDMRTTIDEYFDRQNMHDLRIVSPLGLTDDDVAAIAAVDGVDEVMPAYMTDMFVDAGEKKNIVTRIHRLPTGQIEEKEPENYLNRLDVVEGRLPIQRNECVLVEGNVIDGTGPLSVGNTLTIAATNGDVSGTLADTEFKIVGIVRTSYYFSVDRESATIGDGTVALKMYVGEESFSQEAYSEIFATVAGAQALDSASDEYQAAVDAEADRVEAVSGARCTARYNEVKTDTEQKLADAEAEIADGEQKLAELEVPEWMILDRTSHVSASSYLSNVDKLEAITTVFPIFFFLVAALVALTTMTRMVEEERLQIGTLKALGYKRGQIMFKYLFYAWVATLVGGAAGLAFGFTVIPIVIWNAYGTMYTIPGFRCLFHASLAVLGVGAAFLCTSAATLNACGQTLKEWAAQLLLPKAPKAGKRIFLERITPVWKRMKFTHKVTARNLFRYKKRFFMTVIGVAGCTALLVTGFGLKDSISDIVSKQFGKVFTYDFLVTLSKESALKDAGFQALMDAPEQVTSYLPVQQERISLDVDGQSYDVYLFVPEDEARLDNFIDLHERKSGAAVPLTDDGVVITEKFSDEAGLSPGDTLTLENGEGREGTFTVTGVAENYVENYVYMTPSVYEDAYGSALEYNSVLGILPDDAQDVDEAFSTSLLEVDGVAGLTQMSSMRSSLDDTIASINYVVYVIILCAGMLAFVVLYNLMNINITERTKEIATIKVLGFFEREVEAYVYRESNVLTVIGMLLGLVGGIFLHMFIMRTVEVDMVMFGRDIKPLSFVLSAVLTVVFSLLVNLGMKRKLRNISMVESMKAPE